MNNCKVSQTSATHFKELLFNLFQIKSIFCKSNENECDEMGGLGLRPLHLTESKHVV